MNTRVWLIIGFLVSGSAFGRAQFSPKFLQDSYWGDGKAEFNIYEATEVRYGQPRPSEVLHIYVREPFSDRELVKAEPGSNAGTYPVLKLNQILHIPTGIYVYQQMHSAFWRVDNGALIKATLTSNDSCGNTYKEFRAAMGWRSWFSGGWTYEWRTYWEGMSGGSKTVTAPRQGMFYDELPMRARLKAAQQPSAIGEKGSGEGLLVSVAPSIITSKSGDVSFRDAVFRSWRVPAGSDFKDWDVQVEVRVGDQLDRLVVEAKAPYRLKEWSKADGGKLTLKRSLKLDYWNYNKLGDKERALKSGAAESTLPTETKN